MSSSRRTMIVVAIAVLAIVIVFAAIASRQPQAPDSSLGTDAAGGTSSTSTASGQATDSALPKNTGTATAGTASAGGTSGGQTTSGGSSSGGSSSSGGGSSTDGNSNGGGTTPAASGMTVKVIWWNNTEKVAPTPFEIVYGTQTFRPNIKDAKAVGSLKAIPYDKELKLVVYPAGRSGASYTVPFKVSDFMQSNSDRDAIHVAVTDSAVRVLGNPVENFERSFDR